MTEDNKHLRLTCLLAKKVSQCCCHAVSAPDTGSVTTKPHLAKVPRLTIHVEATCIWLQPGRPQCLLNLLHVAHPASARTLVDSLHLR